MGTGYDKRTKKLRRNPKKYRIGPRRKVAIKPYWKRLMGNVGPLWCEKCKSWGKQTKYFDKRLNRMLYVCMKCNTICQVGRDYCRNCKKWLTGYWDYIDGERVKRCPRCRKVIK